MLPLVGHRLESPLFVDWCRVFQSFPETHRQSSSARNKDKQIRLFCKIVKGPSETCFSNLKGKYHGVFDIFC